MLVQTKALGLRSNRREVFLSILGSCYTILDAKLFEDAATLLPGYTGAKKNIEMQPQSNVENGIDHGNYLVDFLIYYSNIA